MVWLLGEKTENLFSGARVLNLSLVVVKEKTAKKCTEMQNACAGRAEGVFAH